MRTNGARLLVDCLLAQGVTTAFGVPGESYLAVLDALHDVPDRIRLIANRQEGGAAFMAAAWGKLTGQPGICFVTRGPGATNAAIGVHTARQDSSPMILFVGQIATSMRDREAFQEVDYRAVFGTARQVGGGDRPPRPGARARRPRLRGCADRPPGAGGGGAARGHADRRDRRRGRPRRAHPDGRPRGRGSGRDRPPPRGRPRAAGAGRRRRLGRRRAGGPARLRREQPPAGGGRLPRPGPPDRRQPELRRRRRPRQDAGRPPPAHGVGRASSPSASASARS